MSNTLARNKKAFFDYEIFEELEVGIILTGGEVKSIKAGSANLKESYVKVVGEKLLLINANIPQWKQDTREGYDPTRSRKLLLHKKELAKIILKASQEGYTIVPLSMYLKKSLIKLKIGLAKGKKLYEKKRTLLEKDRLMDIRREKKALRY